MLWRRALMIPTISPGAARFMPSTYMPATRKPRAHDRDRDFCVLAVCGAHFLTKCPSERERPGGVSGRWASFGDFGASIRTYLRTQPSFIFWAGGSRESDGCRALFFPGLRDVVVVGGPFRFLMVRVAVWRARPSSATPISTEVLLVVPAMVCLGMKSDGPSSLRRDVMDARMAPPPPPPPTHTSLCSGRCMS